jgi:hypothetical protein
MHLGNKGTSCKLNLSSGCASTTTSYMQHMGEGTLDFRDTNPSMSPFTGHFCLGWWSNIVGFNSGQKQSVKLQNRIWFRKGGGEVREKVDKYSSFIHGGNSSQAGSKKPTMSECISSL